MDFRLITVIIIYDDGEYNINNYNIVVCNLQLLLTVLDGDKSFYSASVSSLLSSRTVGRRRRQLKCWLLIRQAHWYIVFVSVRRIRYVMINLFILRGLYVDT